jgi:inward rectifier potassium channel
MNAFFFSAQTITTVGYGAIAPTGIAPNIVASIEAFVGLLTFAMATGLLYGRFSRPNAKLLYSESAIIAPYLDHTALMFRLANARSSRMINASAKVMLSLIEEENGEKKRNFYSLDLEISSINLLPASWTIVHPITSESPIANMSQEDMSAKDIEIMISFEGYDESYSQQVHSRTSYKNDEIVYGARFEKILGRNQHGQATIALDRLSNYEKVVL